MVAVLGIAEPGETLFRPLLEPDERVADRRVKALSHTLLQPKVQSSIKQVGKSFLDKSANLSVVVTRAKVRSDDEFIFEAVFPIDEIVEVDMTVLVNLLFPMTGCHERHFTNQDFGPVKVRVAIKAWWRAITQISYDWDPVFCGHLRARLPQISNLFAA